jgi:protein-S-isoprenylcysteine O-methyltransferase Ste14
MGVDLPYRIALIAIAAVQLAIGRLYLRKAGAGGTLFQPRAEGPWLAWGAGAFIVLYGLAVLVYLLYPAWMAWSALPLPAASRWCGAPLMALGAAMHLWGSHHLGANLTMSISTREGHTLVTTGPYRWVRHPLYSGGMLESVGVCLLLANGAVALAALGFWAIIAWRTHLEEARLLEAFGAAYAAYQRETGRFLPRCGAGSP